MKGRSGKWRTTSFSEKDAFGALGDRLRVVAGGIIYAEHPEAVVIVLGGRGQLKSVLGVPTVASIIKQELIKLKVPPKRVIIEEKSGNTFEQLVTLSGIIRRGKYDKIMIISNEYHLPRIRTMIKYDSALNRILHDAKALSAEKIVMRKHHKKWAGIIAKAYAGAAMKQRIRLEKKGVVDIKSGVYKYS
ncbi:MAG: hypothetical protein UX20_C0011G0016 [Candidatus Magasanikbacteria bacterium GW2011_GWC2_45_8]|uniref:DUF218 domain-containing protein n=1 Tax=Candidatus Magasanikbacteria bacterium GW2011_GWC2_45_8 TaxID=1619050 RepID=A0A0G1QYX2_9BACT|nr:MAG: hypothetical protein UX20_C0011G0016 [Candidatus Magasanikbacteria bacterium GW2011_GWC2_45_8]